MHFDGNPYSLAHNFMETIILAILASSIISASAVLFYREYREIKRRLDDMDKEIEKLKTSSQLRMPQDAMQDVLNGMAALDSLNDDVSISSQKLENAKVWLKRALAIGTKRENLDK